MVLYFVLSVHSEKLTNQGKFSVNIRQLSVKVPEQYRVENLVSSDNFFGIKRWISLSFGLTRFHSLPLFDFFRYKERISYREYLHHFYRFSLNSPILQKPRQISFFNLLLKIRKLYFSMPFSSALFSKFFDPYNSWVFIFGGLPKMPRPVIAKAKSPPKPKNSGRLQLEPFL